MPANQEDSSPSFVWRLSSGLFWAPVFWWGGYFLRPLLLQGVNALLHWQTAYVTSGTVNTEFNLGAIVSGLIGGLFKLAVVIVTGIFGIIFILFAYFFHFLQRASITPVIGFLAGLTLLLPAFMTLSFPFRIVAAHFGVYGHDFFTLREPNNRLWAAVPLLLGLVAFMPSAWYATGIYQNEVRYQAWWPGTLPADERVYHYDPSRWSAQSEIRDRGVGIAVTGVELRQRELAVAVRVTNLKKKQSLRFTVRAPAELWREDDQYEATSQAGAFAPKRENRIAHGQSVRDTLHFRRPDNAEQEWWLRVRFNDGTTEPQPLGNMGPSKLVARFKLPLHEKSARVEETRARKGAL